MIAQILSDQRQKTTKVFPRIYLRDISYEISIKSFKESLSVEFSNI